MERMGRAIPQPRDCDGSSEEVWVAPEFQKVTAAKFGEMFKKTRALFVDYCPGTGDGEPEGFD
jgi:hypothetical protein